MHIYRVQHPDFAQFYLQTVYQLYKLILEGN